MKRCVLCGAKCKGTVCHGHRDLLPLLREADQK